MKQFLAPLAGAFACAMIAAPAVAQQKVPVVGSLLNVSSYEDFEKPFFNETLPEALDGEMTFDIKSLTEMGLRGPEVLRMVSSGIAPIGAILIGYNTGDDPIFEAVDLAGLAPDAESGRAATEASFAFYEKLLQEKFGVQLLAIGAHPGQVFWCNSPVGNFSDLAGKTVRVNGKGPAELVAALGGTSVFMSFGEVIPALQNRTVDCMVGGTLPTNRAGIHDVTTHVISTPVGWGQIAYIASGAFWNGLTEEQRTIIASQSREVLQDNMWDVLLEQTEQGLACAEGLDTCRLGVKGNMTVVPPSEADTAYLREIFEGQLLSDWATRCGATCVTHFNETIGSAIGVTAVAR